MAKNKENYFNLLELYTHIIKCKDIMKGESLFNVDKLTRNKFNLLFDIKCNMVCKLPFADCIHQFIEKQEPNFIQSVKTKNNNKLMSFMELEKYCVEQKILKETMIKLKNTLLKWVNANQHNVFTKPFTSNKVSQKKCFCFVFCCFFLFECNCKEQLIQTKHNNSNRI